MTGLKTAGNGLLLGGTIIPPRLRDKMAKGRILGRVVSQSRKVNSLSLPAALLWTWVQPWLDRDGMIEAETDFLKTNVVPLRRELDESSIPTLVQEIVDVGLWITFRDPDGFLVAKEKAFGDHQRLEYKKESRSKWEGKELKEETTRRVLDESAARTRTEYNRSEVKRTETTKRLLKDNLSQNNDAPTAVGKGDGNDALLKPKKPDQINDEEKREMAVLCEKIKAHYPPHDFRPYLWLQTNINLNWQTHLHVFRKIAKHWPSLPNAYALKIVGIEEGNFNERLSYKDAQKYKADFMGLLEDIKRLHPEKD